MIELKQDRLVFRFPDVHQDATVSVEFQRTLRIPDDGHHYPLPPGLGRFPIRHVDDFAARIPDRWIEHGGVMLPMYQSEALWVNFSGRYPCAVKVAAGKIDAVTGKELGAGLARRPQNYLVTPEQPWLDGYCVEKGVIRQFVAMPLGAGYSAEEQITGEAEFGGLQIVVHPMTAEAYERLRRLRDERVMFRAAAPAMALTAAGMTMGMGLAPGGRMRQEIFADPHHLEDWDQAHTNRCFVHLANSLVWRHVTGHEPPTVPPTAKEYSKAGLPWFEYYGAGEAAVEGSGILAKLKSVVQMGKDKSDVPLPENESVSAGPVVELRKGLAKDEVREGRF
jgi:hypothetical protein